jgi:ACR3 family arsenite efflux pump ArsB
VPSSSALRTAARIALVGGAAGSVLLMMRAGSHQRSILLLSLFTGWVLSPFIALALANVRSPNWQPVTRTALYGVMLGVSFISLSVYTLHALIPGMKAGFIYLVVPAACWVLIAIALTTAAALSPKRR